MESFLKNILNQTWPDSFIEEKEGEKITHKVESLPFKEGSYHLYFYPDESDETRLEGVLRVNIGANTAQNGNSRATLTVSSDIYELCNLNTEVSSFFHSETRTKKENSIPYFPKESYAGYLGFENKPLLKNDRLTFPINIVKYSHSVKQSRWTSMNGHLIFEIGPSYTWNDKQMEFQGYLECNPNGSFRNRVFKAIWVSDYFRKAIVKIECAPGIPAPKNTKGVTWQSAFNQTKWLVETEYGRDLTHPSGGDKWHVSDLSLVMNEQAKTTKDAWVYYLMCIEYFKGYKPDRKHEAAGWMFDHENLDTNEVPREGAAISAKWQFPNADWCKKCKGEIGNLDLAYLRLAIHEVLHSMGILHDDKNDNLTNITEEVARQNSENFPTEKSFYLNRTTILMLNHYPDPFVRPGMIKFNRIRGFGYPSNEIDSNFSSSSNIPLEFKVSATNKSVPRGAPARFDLRLTNKGSQNIDVPLNIGLKYGFLQIRITSYADSKYKNEVRSIFIFDDFHGLKPLMPKGQINSSVTVLQGSNGALFPSSGTYKIDFLLQWKNSQDIVQLHCNQQIEIDKPNSIEEVRLANLINNTADGALSIIIGNKYNESGRKLIQKISQNKILGRHYYYILFKEAIESEKIDVQSLESLAKIARKNHTVFSMEEAQKTLHKLNSFQIKSPAINRLKKHIVQYSQSKF